jgi:N2,N2-dimethylguanosine tRNA methyltransferase
MSIISSSASTTFNLVFLRISRHSFRRPDRILYARNFLTMTDGPASESRPITVPEGYTLHRENTSHVILPNDNGAFLNPVQEFNRDLSVACIRIWSEELNRTKEAKWKQHQEKRTKNSEKRLKCTATGASLIDYHLSYSLAAGDGVAAGAIKAESSKNAKDTEVYSKAHYTKRFHPWIV